MKRIRICRIALLALGMAALLAGCKKSSTEQVKEPAEQQKTQTSEMVSFALASDYDLTDTVLGEAFSSAQAAVKDSISIKIYDKKSMGSSDDLMAGIRLGTIPLAFLPASVQTKTIPELEILCVPGLFSEPEKLQNFTKGNFGRLLKQKYEEQGVILLGVYGLSERILAAGKPVTTVENLKGLAMGIEPNFYSQRYWEQFGVNTQVLERSDVYTVVRRKTIQGIFCTPEEYERLHLADALKYITTMNLDVDTGVLLVNRETYLALPLEKQTALRTFARLLEETFSGEEWRAISARSFSLRSPQTVLQAPSFALTETLSAGKECILSELQTVIGAERLQEILNSINEKELP